MHLYNAGVYSSHFHLTGSMVQRLTPLEYQHRTINGWYLESYHYIHRERYTDEIRRDGVKIFLDSGAFSAFTQGVQIDIAAYCEFIKKHSDIIRVASVLDAIGDPEGTYNNQKEMERLGTNPLPCYHYGEPTEFLDYYVKNYEYITIGGMVPISTPQLKLWLDRIWRNHLTTPDGRPKIKVHGFGLTSLPLMMRYPWYSVDSSTWIQWAAHGAILLPTVGQLAISSRSSARKAEGKHVDTLSPLETAKIEEVLRWAGADPQRLRDVNFARWAFNLWAFPYYALEKTFENDKFIPETEGLF